VVGADQISQFRPIALINASFKFLSKVFASRLAPVAHTAIHQAQSAFIKGRCILDGIATLHEILHESNSSKEQFVIFKIDFEKAYDTVSWDILEEVLFKKGFDPLWVSWIMQLVKAGHTAVNINGEPGPFFANARGVRQGDPLSPLLFNFVANALAEMLDGAARAGHIHGVSPQLVVGGVTHLQYADDTLILVRNDLIDLMNLKFLLLCFESMSGLKINFAKSEAFVIGADEEDQRRAAFMLNCKLGKLPMTYLGCPLMQ
jgi:hypothetical protein